VHERIGISVVVPSYNHGRFIDAAIRSLLDQEYPNLEIIVVDGGSMDNTIERLRAYGDRISWNQRTGSGSMRCDYQGLRASKDRTRSGVPVEREL
jgi:glycosyltransferase involved in cell wall biosynthesis